MSGERASPIPKGYEPVFDVGFNKYIGSIYRMLLAAEPVRAHFLFDVANRHLNGGGTVHGGLLMSIADIALGSTVYESVGQRRCSTVALNCDFVAAGASGQRIEINTRVTRKTRSVVFVAGSVEAAGTVLLTTSGIWKVLGV